MTGRSDQPSVEASRGWCCYRAVLRCQRRVGRARGIQGLRQQQRSMRRRRARSRGRARVGFWCGLC